MISMRKRYKVFVVIAIIVVSVYFGLTRSNLIDIVSAERNNIVDLTPVNKDFDMLPNFTKYSIRIDANSDSKVIADLEEILNSAQVIRTTIDSTEVDEEPANMVYNEYDLDKIMAYIVVIPGDNSEETLSSIKALSGFISDSKKRSVAMEKPDTQVIQQDLESTREYIEFLENQREIVAQHERNTIDIKIEYQQAKRDSLMIAEKTYRENSMNPALKIIVSNVGAGQVSMAKLVIEFFKNFVISFLALMLLLLIIYLALAFILRLMSYLGIRTAKSSGSGYGGYYKYNSRSGYGSYGGRYGSYGRRRKVKRVYKNRDEGETPESDKK